MWDIIGIILFCVGAIFITLMVVGVYKASEPVKDPDKLLGIPKSAYGEFKKIPKKTEEKPTDTCKPCDANMVTFDYDMNEWNRHW